ncbi:MetQ/NlpA family ABC transporter substrate-binding protein [Anaerotruncus rubiinfantis]|uniref:MetQ/NlpA family ABC transporter substrate-binding protein n=1 Tax=Anaerotruncus rubiinfantis TaxID=1720200 RepID=UPI0008351961|nr:MetQ/NlpA family ABC transporter substrate-binding protein [Anaerotruncus rubiinfantis]
MNYLKKSLALVFALALCLSAAACGGSDAPASSAAPAASAPASSEATDGSSALAETITLTVGASPAPHAEILEQVKPLLEAEGIQLEIKEFTDYVMPNKVLDAGEIDANYFQHKPYLDNFNAENGTDLAAAAFIHFEPLGVYPGKTASLDALPDGGVVAVPNDPSNEARALQLLEKLGLIKLKEGVGLNATKLDIIENAKNLDIQEIEAAQLPRLLPDVDIAVVNGNYAVEAGIADTVLDAEDKESEAAQEFANIIAVRAGDESRPEIQKLIEALQSDTIRDYITNTYGGVVIPVF